MIGVLVAASTVPVAAQGLRGNPLFRESVTLDLNTQATKTMQSAQDLLDERQWEKAIPILQQLIDNHGDTLIAVETGRYWNVADMCHWLIANLPAEFLQPYRQRVDGQANEWLETARRSSDDRLLKQIIRRAFCSSVGDDALWLLGDLAFERGEFAVARQAWERLVPAFLPAAGDANVETQKARHLVFPDSAFPLAEVRARLVLCSIFDGQHVRARLELDSFAKLHPESNGDLLGQTGVLSVLLEQQLKSARAWSFQEPRQHEFTQFGGSKERNQPVGQEHYVGDRVWEIKLPKPNLNLMNQRPNDPGPLSYFPVVNDGKLFVCDAYRVFAFDLATGKPAWRAGREQPADNLPQRDEQGEIYNNAFGFPILPGQSVGVARYAMTISDGRLYARMGPPYVRKSRIESNVISEIVGLDIAQGEGSIVFRVTSDVFDQDADSPEATKWCFEGTPLVHDGRVYTTIRRASPEDEIVALCFDESSQLIWTRRICVSLRNSPDHFNLIGHRSLTWGNGQLFVNTGCGAIAALDAADGKINWVVTYPSTVELTQDEFENPHKIPMETSLYDHGVVFVAPIDSHELFALEASTGHVIWHEHAHDRVLDLLGVVDNQLILGGLKLKALDARTGQGHWEAGQDNADAWNYGRAWLTKDHVYRPTRTTIEKISLRTGAPVQMFDLKENAGRVQEWGGNLLVSGGLMIVAQPDRVIAFGSNVRDQNAPLTDPNASGKETPNPSGANDNELKNKVPLDDNANSKADANQQAQAAIDAGDMLALRNVVRKFPAAPERAAWFDQVWRSHVQDRPWEALAAINEELRTALPAERAFQLRLDRALLLESLGQTRAVDLGRDFKQSIQPGSPLEGPTKQFTSYVSRAQGTVTPTLQFTSRHKSAWLGLNPFENAADEYWCELFESARENSSLQDRLGKEAPLRHQVLAEHFAGKLPKDFDEPLSKKSPWLVRRLWSRKFEPNDGKVRVDLIGAASSMLGSAEALQSSVFSAAPIVLLEAHDALTSIDPQNGEPLWNVQPAQSFTFVDRGLGLVLFDDGAELQARHSLTGELVWRTRMQELGDHLPMPRKFEVLGDQLIFVTDHQLASFDVASGKLVWQFDAAKHRWSPTNSKTFNRPTFWQCDRKQAIYLPRGSADYFRIDLRTGLPTQKFAIAAMFPAGVELLSAPSADEVLLAGLSPVDRRVVWGMSSTGRKWEHALAGNSHGVPAILHNQDAVVILEDGVFGVGIERATGHVRWKAVVHSYPVADPAAVTRLIGNRLVAISDQSIKAWDAANGISVWNQPMTKGDWSMTSHLNHIIAVNRSADASRVLVLDAGSGSPIQSFLVEGELSSRDILVTAQAMFLHSSCSIECFVALTR